MGLCQGEGLLMLLVLRRFSEKFRAKNKLFFTFVDLENTSDQVPKEVICFALRWKVVPEYLVNGVMSLYRSCKTADSIDGKLSSSFWSAMSPRLFIMVMDVLTEDVKCCCMQTILFCVGNH